ncbi:NAD(P)/FAD-dependent oxidoreductase [Amycolatopsis sp. NPDC005003]
MLRTFEAVVIGAGMFGSATAKHLGRAGVDVAVVGPAEPADGTPVDRHSFGAYFDEARITRRLGWDPVWQATDSTSLDRFRAIEAESGIGFFHECGSLILMAKSIGHRTADMLSQCEADSITVERSSAGDLGREFPELGLPPMSGGVEGLFERKQAGYLNPRQLVRAQLALTESTGGQVVRGAVKGVAKDARSGLWRVAVQRDGRCEEIGAERLVVAAGALTNQNDVLPAGIELALHVFTEPNLLFEVADDQLERFQAIPPVVTIDPEDSGNENMSLYLLPPIRYPDGKWYVRIGPGMQPIVRELTDTGEMESWCAAQRITPEQYDFLSRMRSLLLPDLRPVSVREACCLIDKTPSRYPYLGHVTEDETLTVAVGGNGHGARGSDEIGRLAATVALGQPWISAVPQEVFKPLTTGTRAAGPSGDFHKPPFGLC